MIPITRRLIVETQQPIKYPQDGVRCWSRQCWPPDGLARLLHLHLYIFHYCHCCRGQPFAEVFEPKRPNCVHGSYCKSPSRSMFTTNLPPSNTHSLGCHFHGRLPRWIDCAMSPQVWRTFGPCPSCLQLSLAHGIHLCFVELEPQPMPQLIPRPW